MHDDSKVDTGKIPAPSTNSHTIAAHSQRESEAKRALEIDRCKRACEAYDTAHAEFLDAFGSVTQARGNRNAAGGAGLAGLAILTMAGSTFLWGMAFVIAAGCCALAVREQFLLNGARNRCQAAIQVMYIEYGSAKKECVNGDCLPPRPDQTCP
jgi:hypothetical protein